jgi:hypothetical protein
MSDDAFTTPQMSGRDDEKKALPIGEELSLAIGADSTYHFECGLFA